MKLVTLPITCTRLCAGRIAPMQDNTKRFSDRVINYTKYRPSYPQDAIRYILDSVTLPEKAILADIGSGTGKLTELLLPKCHKVYAVEPNTEMRLAAEALLQKNTSFISINGTAENTTLEDRSIDCITVAQAFHWFDLDKVRIEFLRILKKEGPVFLIWNRRSIDTEFLVAYENLLQNTVPEYEKVNHRNMTPEIIQGFIPIRYTVKKFANNQLYDWPGLVGRLQSSSYTPKADTEEYKKMEKELKMIFEKHERNGKILFNYETEMYSGRIT